MKFTPKYLIIFFSAIAFCSAGFSQITATNASPYNTTQNLVNNVLLGQGVSASNITSLGQAVQRGFFNGMNSNIGLDSGLVLTSGDIASVPPNGSGSNPSLPTDSPASIVNDLKLVSNTAFKMLGHNYTANAIYDMAVIEFDFIPVCDSLKFNYVFSSNEYLAYVNTAFNDIFAFFLYGPGITPTDNLNNSTGTIGADGNPDFSSFTINGTDYYAQNIAVVPNTSPALPITISSINPSSYPQYYIDNSSHSTVGMNGFTKVLTAAAQVQPGQTYHIRLVVSDVADGILDTDVFIEAGSFTSSGEIQMSSNFITSDANCNGACDGNATVIPSGGTTPYSFVWDNGQTESTASGLCAGVHNVIVSNSTGCPNIFQVSITEPPQPIIIKNVSSPLCNGYCDGSASVLVSGNNSPYSFLWSNGCNVSSCQQLCTGNYTITITDASGCSITDSISVSSPTSITVVISATPDSGNASGTATVFSSGGIPPYTFLWNDQNSQTMQTATGLQTGIYVVIITDSNGCSVADSAEVLFFMGTEANYFFSNIQIYPNPVQDKLFITNIAENNFYLSVYNYIGQEVINKKINFSGNIYSLPIKNLPDGIYNLKVSSETEEARYFKFVKNE